MTRKLMIGAAVSALMVSGALAQSPQSPSSSPAPSATPPASAAPSASQPSSGKPNFVMSQKPDQWLASKFRGTDVIGPDDKKIGDVTDILFDKNGKIEAFVVSVGGFLGMGAKDVALAPGSFNVIPGTEGGADMLKLSVNQEELKQAQNFAPYQPPRATTTGSGSPTGAGPGGAPRPSGTRGPSGN